MSNEDRQPVDRLARGYARDELRKLRKIVGSFGQADSAFIRAHDLISKRVGPYFNAGKRLSSTLATRFRKEMVAYIEENFAPFAISKGKRRIYGFDGVLSDVDSFYYMQPSTHQIMKNDGTVYDEMACEIRCLRLVVDRRRVCLDDFSGMVIFTDHALARLVERGACKDRPINYLTAHVADILTFVPLFTIASLVVEGRSGVIIPTPHGILVGDFVIAEDTQTVNYAFRRRIIFDIGGGGMQSLKTLDPMQGDRASEGHVLSIRISTFMDTDGIGADKTWCREKMLRLLDDHRGIQPEMIGFLTSPEIMMGRAEALRTKPMFDDFNHNIFADERWQRANKLNWNLEEEAA